MRRFGLILCAALVSFAQEAVSPGDLLLQANRAFYEKEAMAEAEALYRRLMSHPDATEVQRANAHRFVGACLGRRKKYAEAIEVQRAFLKKYPKHQARHYTLLFQGKYLQLLGKEKEARACWEAIVKEAPDSKMAGYADAYLAGGAATRERKVVRYEPKRVLAAEAGQPGVYLVVRVALQDERYRAVAEKAARFHRGKIVEFDGKDFAALAATLKKHRPEHVLFVVAPDALDVNLHRRILMASTKLDRDIFPDFAFGYFTARDGAALEKLWVRTKELHEKGLRSRRWHSTAVTTGIKSTVYEGSISASAKAAGFTGNQYYFATIDKDPDTMAFVGRRLKELEQASVITMTGCGDPQGIWLFNDRRNAERSKHWEYDPQKVGHDPEGEMPRITADRFAALQLKSPIVWTGVCHNGAVERVYIEGDIVSTFGRTRKATLHRLAAKRSLCLAMIDAGATAFLCPIAANHGMSVSREVDFALENGATLGETMKSTYDDIHLATRGGLVLGVQVEGEPRKHPEYVMQGGGANRILIGDPALRPFKATPHPLEKVEIKNKTEKGFDVVVTWKAGFHPRGWDMYGEDRKRDWTVRARIALDGLVPAGRELEFSASVATTGEDGKPLPHVMTHAEPEAFCGRRYLHLQANAPRDAVMRKYVRAVFQVAYEDVRD